MKEIVEIFRMKELKLETRISVIEKLGSALNMQYSMNWTGELVTELNGILKDEIVERDSKPF